MTEAKPLPTKDGEVVTAADFGFVFIVEIIWNTDFDGRRIDPGKEAYPRTLHGPFENKDEAERWMNDYPEDKDVHDMRVSVLNNVR